MANWSKLPDDILKFIAEKLHSMEDYVRFGGVCKLWHLVTLQKDCSSCSKLPWMMLTEKENSDMRGFYSPFNNKIYEILLPEIHGRRCWGSPCGWLVTIGTDMEMHLLNPLSRVQIPLPPLQRCPNLNKLICTPKLFRDCFVKKAVISSSPSSSDCVVLAIYSDYEKLAFAKPGDEAWTPLECPPGSIDDIMYFNGNFFAVDFLRKVFICNSAGSHIKTIAFAQLPPVDDLDYEAKYLVEAGGEIYMVIRCLYDTKITDTPYLKTWSFVVYKLDMCTKKWAEVRSLGNWSFFLGNNYSFSIWAPDYTECGKNCAYFTDDYVGLYNTTSSYDMGIYSFEDRKLDYFLLKDVSLSVFSPPLWIRPSFW